MYHKVISVIAILAGVLFLVASKSDIQLGFGITFLLIGALNFKKNN